MFNINFAVENRENKMKIKRLGRHIVQKPVGNVGNQSILYYILLLPSIIAVVITVLAIYCYFQRIKKVKGLQRDGPIVKHLGGRSGIW